MDTSIRVMIERGKKKRSVAVAFDWPGWDRSGNTEEDALRVLDAYRHRYSLVAGLAGLGDDFEARGELDVVERMDGIGMTDYYGLSGRPATPELTQMDAETCERKIALLRAAWSTFDAVGARVSPDLRKGPRGGGRERDDIIRHVNAVEIEEFARKVGVRVPPETWRDPEALRAYRDAFCEAIRDSNARGPAAGAWTVQFLIRRCAWHALDHAWEMEDRDPPSAA
jgi:hypothetical protein